ncbi:hypothetical protein [Aliterella atlantica]|uniref:Uncharacterized protein n=1 Tax=Aliterella atlantica CENA595 TaxID=1618023 RepID=A0A0D8ZPP5_9CYAN|nr:hypothetical protein [Aliterella atlantica]KJH70690.1 hypothetical protein UH38_16685 [Aliterella atlantica CENA595]
MISLFRIGLILTLISISFPTDKPAFSISRASYQACDPVNNPKDCRKVPMARDDVRSPNSTLV